MQYLYRQSQRFGKWICRTSEKNGAKRTQEVKLDQAGPKLFESTIGAFANMQHSARSHWDVKQHSLKQRIECRRLYVVSESECTLKFNKCLECKKCRNNQHCYQQTPRINRSVSVVRSIHPGWKLRHDLNYPKIADLTVFEEIKKKLIKVVTMCRSIRRKKFGSRTNECHYLYT